MTTPLTHWRTVGAWRWRIEAKSADLWVGLYHQRTDDVIDVWLCLLPCLPLHLRRGAPRTRAGWITIRREEI